MRPPDASQAAFLLRATRPNVYLNHVTQADVQSHSPCRPTQDVQYFLPVPAHAPAQRDSGLVERVSQSFLAPSPNTSSSISSRQLSCTSLKGIWMVMHRIMSWHQHLGSFSASCGRSERRARGLLEQRAYRWTLTWRLESSNRAQNYRALTSGRLAMLLLTIRGERHCVDPTAMPLERSPVRDGRRIPEPDGSFV
jgi:hypothetical protein